MSQTIPSGHRYCPDCFEGTQYHTCKTCEGRGTDPLGACPDCEGVGEFKVHPCRTCKGSGFVSSAIAKLRDVVSRHPGSENRIQVGRIRVRVGGVESATAIPTQIHHGITDYALLAYLQKREALRDPEPAVTAVKVTVDPAFEWENGILIQNSVDQLVLTGVSWGYGGEGPNGLATILHDLGKFPDHESALKAIAAIPMHEVGWSF